MNQMKEPTIEERLSSVDLQLSELSREKEGLLMERQGIGRAKSPVMLPSNEVWDVIRMPAMKDRIYHLGILIGQRVSKGERK